MDGGNFKRKLKPLNIMRVFMYHTVKSFLHTGEVSDWTDNLEQP